MPPLQGMIVIDKCMHGSVTGMQGRLAKFVPQSFSFARYFLERPLCKGGHEKVKENVAVYFCELQGNNFKNISLTFFKDKMQFCRVHCRVADASCWFQLE